jgi:hypothetical protein
MLRVCRYRIAFHPNDPALTDEGEFDVTPATGRDVVLVLADAYCPVARYNRDLIDTDRARFDRCLP